MSATPELEIRASRPEDIDAIIRLHELAIVPLWEELGGRNSLEKVRGLLKDRMGKERMVSALDGGELAAFLWSMTYEEPLADQRVHYIVMILVRPDWQGRGLGRRLMEREMEHAASVGADVMKLEVMSGSEKAIGFYERLGFREGMKVMMRDVAGDGRG